MAEMVEIFNPDGSATGEILEREKAFKHGKRVKVVQVWIVNPRGEALLQLRNPDLKVYPNYWAASAGGVPDVGEAEIDTAIRETHEEIGVKIARENLTFAGQYNEDEKWKILHSVFVARVDLPLSSFKLDPEEGAGLEYFSLDRIRKMSAAEMEEARILPMQSWDLIFKHLEKTEA